MYIHDYCPGKVIESIGLEYASDESNEIVAKVTFVGTDHYLLVRSQKPDAVSMELHWPD